ncbi:uncharacterized protein LOC130990442 [Salvia miltiorrhiza]|uniref:uncharacterized protein LOC130990442 n=1 Tax=Salvia miltiorrhiza TaxID=226208 RepID=UPI0025AC4C89|nr:uncharacterized protein LOC130990442 [Salvia miltiorrhiza]
MLSRRLTICWLVGASKCKGEGYEAAPNCARNECPAYTVLHSHKEFEIRSYKDAKWVHSPTISSNSYKPAASKAFRQLFAYYKGKNRENMIINMTSPVLVGVDNSAYTVYFYLPQMYQKSAPQPVRGEIKTVSLPLPGHKYAAVKRFDGMITDESIATNLESLKKSLEASPDYRRAAQEGLSMLAAYNSPRQLTNRVNEVFIWFN